MAAISADTLFLKPALGRRVRHEDGRLLDDDGETVTASTHWTRRLEAEDVVATTPPKPKAEKAN